MKNSNITKLEIQINSLIQSRNRLNDENKSLRQKLMKLTQEKAELLDKNTRAITKVKRVISQLRDELQ